MCCNFLKFGWLFDYLLNLNTAEVDMVVQTRQQGSRPKFKSGGKHRKSINKIVKIIEGLGFEFVKQSKKEDFG